MRTTCDSAEALKTEHLKTLGGLLQRTQNPKRSCSLQIIYPSGKHLAMPIR